MSSQGTRRHRWYDVHREPFAHRRPAVPTAGFAADIPGRTQTTLRASACVVPDVPEGTRRQLGAVDGTEVILPLGAVTAVVPRLTSRRAKASGPDDDKPRATQLIANGYLGTSEASSDLVKQEIDNALNVADR